MEQNIHSSNSTRVTTLAEAKQRLHGTLIRVAAISKTIAAKHRDLMDRTGRSVHRFRSIEGGIRASKRWADKPDPRHPRPEMLRQVFNQTVSLQPAAREIVELCLERDVLIAELIVALTDVSTLVCGVAEAVIDADDRLTLVEGFLALQGNGELTEQLRTFVASQARPASEGATRA
jgi:hypothetical protein